MSDFLAEVSLLTDQDNDKEENSDKVTMMTVHAVQGLEFTNVFVVGLEEDLFPRPYRKITRGGRGRSVVCSTWRLPCGAKLRIELCEEPLS